MIELKPRDPGESHKVVVSQLDPFLGDSNYTIYARCPVCGDEHLIEEFGVCSKG